MILFTEVWKDIDSLNSDITTLAKTVPQIDEDEWLALVGRYGSSHIRYVSVVQFKAAFITVLRENLGRLRAKIKINDRLRSLTESEALDGDEIITNVATNPDTEPSTENYEPLPYISSQTGQKETRGRVTALYNWKHSIGGQAYNEFLDGFRHLFRVILEEEIVVYEKK